MTLPEGERRDLAISIVLGLATGFLAGLVGLGGSEERIWFILFILQVPLRSMFLVNLIVSLVTSASSFFIRFSQGLISAQAITLALTMILTSPIGAYVGGIFSQKSPERGLRVFLASILTVVSISLILKLLGHSPAIQITIAAPIDILLAAVFGFLVGIIGGLIGVAGGEYRIPVFYFLFSTGILVAGTASQLVSIPTLLAAIYRHHQSLRLTRREVRITIVLAASSFVGVLLDVPALSYVRANNLDWVVELIFAAILLYTAVRLYMSALHRRTE